LTTSEYLLLYIFAFIFSLFKLLFGHLKFLYFWESKEGQFILIECRSEACVT
jgi:hypothetical protein